MRLPRRQQHEVVYCGWPAPVPLRLQVGNHAHLDLRPAVRHALVLRHALVPEHTFHIHYWADHLRACAGYDLPDVPEPTGEAFAKAVSLLLPYLLSHRSRLAALAGGPGQGPANPSHDPPGASPIGLDRDNGVGPHADGDDVQREDEGYREAGGHAAGEAPGFGDRVTELAAMGPQQRRQLAVAVDTAILKACTP